MISKYLYVLFLCFFLCGCTPNKIETYTIPAQNADTKTTYSDDTLSWCISDKWSVLPNQDFRVGSYELTSINGGKASLSISKINGIAGGQINNIQRWRRQLSLPAAEEADIKKTIIPVDFHIHFDIVDLVSDRPVGGGTYQRTLATISTIQDQTYFFKLTGAYAAVDDLKAEFITILQSVELQ